MGIARELVDQLTIDPSCTYACQRKSRHRRGCHSDKHCGRMESSPMPSYIGCVTDISAKIQKYFEHNDLDFATYPSRFLSDCKRFCVISQYDIVFTCSLALLWTILRHILTKTVFLVSILICCSHEKYRILKYQNLPVTCTKITAADEALMFAKYGFLIEWWLH